MDNMRCYLEIYVIFAYKTTFIFVHMGRKYFINYTTDLFDFIEKNRSELIKEKLLSASKAREYSEFVINYAAANAAADVFRLRLSLEDIWHCNLSMSRKLAKRLAEAPELKANKIAKHFQKLCEIVQVQAEKAMKEDIKKAVKTRPVQDFFKLVAKQAGGEQLTTADIESVLSMLHSASSNNNEELRIAKERPFHGQTIGQDTSSHPLLGKPLSYFSHPDIDEEDEEWWTKELTPEHEDTENIDKIVENLNVDDYDWQNFDGWVEHPMAIYKPVMHVWKYRLRIVLDTIKPPIWREIEVPSSITLTSIASIILLSMGWAEEHLHQFIMRNGRQSTFYATSIHEIMESRMQPETKDGRQYCIADLLKQKGDSVTFEYDYGDCWLHTVTLLAVNEYGDEKKEVSLLGGERACPPNDCGGVPGYQRLCMLMEKPASPDALSEMEWLGFRYDPELFPLKEAQKIVKRCNR